LSDPTSETSAFALSRIESQGWNAAKQLIGAGKTNIDISEVTARSPYRKEEERSRWAAGFVRGLESTVAGRNSWRPATAKRVRSGEQS
jgi:hypothetical protein